MDTIKLIKPGQIACLDFPKTTKVKTAFALKDILFVVDKEEKLHSATIQRVETEDFATVAYTKDGFPWVFYN